MNICNIDTIAKQCGVSKATVSRVFTGKGRVSDQVSKLVLFKARELNYRPQQMATRENIAIVCEAAIDFLGEYGFAQVIIGYIIHEINRLGYQPLIIEASKIDSLIPQHTKAVILFLRDETITDYEQQLKNLSVPKITINRMIPGVHCFCSDHAMGVKLAVAHLSSYGHRRIALVLDNSKNWAGKERQRGYGEAMGQLELPELPTFTYRPEFSMIEVMSEVMRYRATAAIICGESIGTEAAYAFNILRLKVPEDISIISSERPAFSRWCNPPHTTIDHNIQMICSELFSSIEKIIAKPDMAPLIKILPSKLIERQSVASVILN